MSIKVSNFPAHWSFLITLRDRICMSEIWVGMVIGWGFHPRELALSEKNFLEKFPSLTSMNA